MITAESLAELPTKQILSIALEQGVHIPSSARTKSAIIPILMAGLALEPKAKGKLAVAVPKPPLTILIAQEVKALLANHIARGLLVDINESDSTWTISYRDKQDSGHLSTPAIVLARCVDMVMI